MTGESPLTTPRARSRVEAARERDVASAVSRQLVGAGGDRSSRAVGAVARSGVDGDGDRRGADRRVVSRAGPHLAGSGGERFRDRRRCVAGSVGRRSPSAPGRRALRTPGHDAAGGPVRCMAARAGGGSRRRGARDRAPDRRRGGGRDPVVPRQAAATPRRRRDPVSASGSRQRGAPGGPSELARGRDGRAAGSPHRARVPARRGGTNRQHRAGFRRDDRPVGAGSDL